MATASVGLMTISIHMVTFDARDPHALADWWARQTGGSVEIGEEEGFVMAVLPDGSRLGFQLVPEPTPGKNRLHLDCSAEAVETEVQRLLADGAREVGRFEFADFSWVTLADPEGNLFDVAAG